MARTRRVSRKKRSHAGDSSPLALQRRPVDKVLIGTVSLVLVVLGALADDRHVGFIADGRQMIRTAVALAETGEIGQAVGRDFTIERADGDAVSRFGIGTSLLQVPAAAAAPGVERVFGAGSSQALFLILPWLAIGVAAGAAGKITRVLGGDNWQVAATVLLASLASPLGSYAALEFSEPVQAAALTLALLASFAARSRGGHSRLELMAGFAAGFAVLTKSSLIISAPFALLPLVAWNDWRRTRRALLRAGAGAFVPLVAWVYFELVRFGRLFGGYPDDRFTHPWWDGLWRLLVGPNRGFLLFWPAFILFALFLWSNRGDRRPLTTPGASTWAGALMVFATQLAVAAGYWGWHGMEGWGPRLFLAATPLLAPFAARANVPRPTLLIAVLACLASNLPPLLQHPTPVATYVMNLRWPEVPDGEKQRYPFYATGESEAGRPTVVPFEVLEKVPAANPWRLYTWFWRTSQLDDEALAEQLSWPPWRGQRPDLSPITTWPAPVARQVAPPPRIGFLGRSLTGRGGPYGTVYLDALLDQVIRANQMGRIARALELSEKRMHLRADGETAAWRLETLRRAGRPMEAEALLRSLPESTRGHPLINVALALFDRDFGEDTRGRALLGSVADAFPGAPVQQALSAPVAEWPATLDLMTRAPRRDAAVLGVR